MHDASGRTASGTAENGGPGAGTASGAEVVPEDGAGRPARRPSTTEVFRAQLRLLFRRGWSLAALVLLTGLPMALLSLSGPAAGADATLSWLVGDLWTFPLLLSLGWPLFVVWRDDTPSERAYHWTLPVDRSAHQLLRAAAGWVHLAAGLALGVLFAWTSGAVVHGGMPVGRASLVVGLFPSVTLFYLLGTLAALTTDRPLVWIFVAYLLVGATQALATYQGWLWLDRAVAEVFTTGPLSLSAAAAGPQGADVGSGSDLVAWRPWQAVPLWLAVTGALTVAAARVHFERVGKG